MHSLIPEFTREGVEERHHFCVIRTALKRFQGSSSPTSSTIVFPTRGEGAMQPFLPSPGQHPSLIVTGRPEFHATDAIRSGCAAVCIHFRADGTNVHRTHWTSRNNCRIGAPGTADRRQSEHGTPRRGTHASHKPARSECQAQPDRRLEPQQPPKQSLRTRHVEAKHPWDQTLQTTAPKHSRKRFHATQPAKLPLQLAALGAPDSNRFCISTASFVGGHRKSPQFPVRELWVRSPCRPPSLPVILVLLLIIIAFL